MTKFASFIIVVLLLFSVATSAYSCFLPSHHLPFATDHEASSIHCPGGYLGTATQVTSIVRSYKSDIGQALENPASETHPHIVTRHLREITFVGPFYQRNLYQLEEVYRL